MMLPQASADAVAAPLAAAVVAKVQPAKIEPKVDISAPFTLTVQGDVKDPNELAARLQPLLEQHRREIAQQLENRQLYDAPHL
jgi:DMSO/TMAO reductase YedYZ molybdopterin-dependent catalytic subunit